MLPELKRLNLKQAEQLLAELAQGLLPKPSEETTEHAFEFRTPIHREIMNHFRRKGKIDSQDQSEEAKAKLLQLISDEISSLVLSRKKKNEAKARLGHSGDLRLDFYNIKYGEQFKVFEGLGVRRNHVDAALRKPNQYQHLLPERLKVESIPVVSLFQVEQKGLNSKDDFTFLVHTKRNGATLDVLAAWRLYHDVVSPEHLRSPLDSLRAFVKIYGLKIQIGKSNWAKFFLYEVFPMDFDKPRTRVMQIKNPINHSFISTSVIRISSLDVIEVGSAYAIDEFLYKNDLSIHGVDFKT